MSNDKRPYVRIYHVDLMRDYPEVCADDSALALWLRLLVIADRMWPTRPELPRSAKGRGLALLLRSGLVQQDSTGHFSIRGYDKERVVRQDAARNAAAVRWHSTSNAVGNAETMPRPKTSPNTEGNGLSNPREERRPRSELTPIRSLLPDIKVR